MARSNIGDITRACAAALCHFKPAGHPTILWRIDHVPPNTKAVLSSTVRQPPPCGSFHFFNALLRRELRRHGIVHAKLLVLKVSIRDIDVTLKVMEAPTHTTRGGTHKIRSPTGEGGLS